MFLARKINFPKWMSHPDLAEGEIQADAVTADLRTLDNVLSVWRCGDPEASADDFQEAVLAMASTMVRADKIDVAWLQKEELEHAGYTLQQTDGETSVRDLVSWHYDLCGLDYARLGDIALRIRDAVVNQQSRRFRRTEVLNLLATAVDTGRLDIQDLKPNLGKEVEQALKGRRSK